MMSKEALSFTLGVGTALAVPVAGYTMMGGSGLALGLFVGPLLGYGIAYAVDKAVEKPKVPAPAPQFFGYPSSPRLYR